MTKAKTKTKTTPKTNSTPPYSILDPTRVCYRYTIEVLCDIDDAYDMEEGIETALGDNCKGPGGEIVNKEILTLTVKQAYQLTRNRHIKIEHLLIDIH